LPLTHASLEKVSSPQPIFGGGPRGGALRAGLRVLCFVRGLSVAGMVQKVHPEGGWRDEAGRAQAWREGAETRREGASWGKMGLERGKDVRICAG
jgi:hypothetical protein